MIKRLHISNYALIDTLDIEFAEGLTIITGETGAGKSIILGALSLILGERADSKAIRDTSAKTIVERQSAKPVTPATRLVQQASAFIRRNALKGIGAMDVVNHLYQI